MPDAETARPPRPDRVLVEKNVAVPLRDGVTTYGDLYRPLDIGPVPAVISRTAYNKEAIGQGDGVSPLKSAERGYAVLVVDTRGRASSEGEFRPFETEGPDGYDTVEWAAAQPWCDGNVALSGGSYVGATALLAARERPPSLRCVIATSTADDYHDGWIFSGGAFQLGFAATWSMTLASTSMVLRRDYAGRISPEQREEFGRTLAGGLDPLWTRPLSALPSVSAKNIAPWWATWLQHERRDDYWAGLSLKDHYGEFDVPILHVGGWFDVFGPGTVRNYAGITAAGRADQQLIVGPWAHTESGATLGEMAFGPRGARAAANIVGESNRFLDKHLRPGGRPAASDPSPVRYFLMGANEWRLTSSWPPPDARPFRLYLQSGGKANTLHGDGALTETAPAHGSTPDRYVYDPDHPVETHGGPIVHMTIGAAGPFDQRRTEEREDVLCYSTAPVTAPLTIAGRIRVSLWAVSDCPDTDWTAKLVDVLPDGRAVSICDGIIRARFRHSLQDPQFLEPGEPEEYEIDLGHMAHQFPAGHRVRIEISSSNFPRFDRNPNSGEPLATASTTRIATQHVLHDESHRSFLEFDALDD